MRPTKISFESTAIPNLKHGKPLTQALLNQLSAINAGNVADNGHFLGLSQSPDR